MRLGSSLRGASNKLLVGGMLVAVVATLTGPATAASAATPPCRVTNLSTMAVYTGTGANLQIAIDAASSGVSLQIKGTCVGNFNTDSKDIALIGATSNAYPRRATLDGQLSGRVLMVEAGTVSVRNLRIMRGSGAGGAGGIYNRGTLILAGSTLVTLCRGGESVANDGTLTMNGHAAISGNKTRGVANGGPFTMNDWSSIADNTAGNGQGGDGGGVLTGGFHAPFVMNDSSSITGNQASIEGGGVFVSGDLTMNDASTISGNTAGQRGGGVYDQGTGTLTGVVDGGNVFSNVPDNVYPSQA